MISDGNWFVCCRFFCSLAAGFALELLEFRILLVGLGSLGFLIDDGAHLSLVSDFPG